MRLELEIDYEPSETEAAQIRAAATAIERCRIVHGWSDFTGCEIQGVGVVDDREGSDGD